MITSRTPQISITLRWAVLFTLLKAELTLVEITQAVSQGTSGALQPSVGTIYPSIAGLRNSGLITEHRQERPSDGRPRFVYRISVLGCEEVKAYFQFHENFSNLGITLEQKRRAAS